MELSINGTTAYRLECAKIYRSVYLKCIVPRCTPTFTDTNATATPQVMSSRPKRVAVIGAGISGVVAAAHLNKENIEVTVFERSSAAGGVWSVYIPMAWLKLTTSRLFDERPPLEASYPSIVASEAERKQPFDPTLNLTEEEYRRLLHAPPGYVFPY